MPVVRSEVREVEVLEVAVDFGKVLGCWSAKDLDDFDQLIGSCRSGEDWLTE